MVKNDLQKGRRRKNNLATLKVISKCLKIQKNCILDFVDVQFRL